MTAPTATEDLGISTGGDVVSHILHLGSNDGGVFTPDGILAAMGKVDQQIMLLDHEVYDAQPDVDEAFYALWVQLIRDWIQFKSDHSSWVSRSWNSTRDGLLAIVQRYHDLRTQWVGAAPDSGTHDFTVKDAPTTPDAIADWGKQFGVALKSVGIGAAVIAGVGVAGYLALRYVR